MGVVATLFGSQRACDTVHDGVAVCACVYGGV